jgi:cytochrome c oxidase subunit 3
MNVASTHSIHKGAPVAARLGIWAFLATELLLFGGLFTAYAVFRLRYPELFHKEHLHLNRLMGALNTVLLLSSSLSMAVGIAAIRQGRQRVLKLALAITLALATGFLGIKYIEWSEDFSHGLFPASNLFFGLYFMMTGLHGLHVIFGMAVMVWLLMRAQKGEFSSEYNTPVEVTGLYWHLALIPASLLLWPVGTCSSGYAACAFLLGSSYLVACHYYLTRGANYRTAFRCSIAYILLLFTLIIADLCLHLL